MSKTFHINNHEITIQEKTIERFKQIMTFELDEPEIENYAYPLIETEKNDKVLSEYVENEIKRELDDTIKVKMV